jgi:hypothetical protein
MVETERAPGRFLEGLPIGTRGFQQAVGADDVGLDKVRGAINGAVDVRLGGQVHNGLRLKARQHGADGGLVDDIGLHELIAAVGGDAGE